MAKTQEKDYVWGTHDEEMTRLGLQHRVWRPRTLDAWRRAGFSVGQTLLDVGCGPGYATIDLAEIVGPSGRVVAMDQSRRFLDALAAVEQQRGLSNIVAHELDLEESALPPVEADGAWCRWVLAFMKNPRRLLEQVAGRLKRGGVLVAYEYFDYSTWRLAPRVPEIEELVSVVIESLRADGGEVDVGLDIPLWLNELGFEIKTLNPIVDVVPRTNYVWEWPKAFIRVCLRRMVDLGRLTSERAREISDAFAASEAKPHTLMITPGMLEIIAVRK
jgi:SAM-dependent methyltransferase